MKPRRRNRRRNRLCIFVFTVLDWKQLVTEANAGRLFTLKSSGRQFILISSPAKTSIANVIQSSVENTNMHILSYSVMNSLHASNSNWGTGSQIVRHYNWKLKKDRVQIQNKTANSKDTDFGKVTEWCNLVICKMWGELLPDLLLKCCITHPQELHWHTSKSVLLK